MKKRKRKLRWKNLMLLILILVSFIILVISLVNIIDWYRDNKKIDKQINSIEKTVQIIEVIDNENTEIIETKDEKTGPYWDYIKMNLIDVDFKELLKKNNETIGWIQVLGTNINYPFVQTTNNDFYLTHSFDKSYNKAGWVFLDYRNNISSLDQNTIIYAHGRYDKTMFGSIRRLESTEWFKDTNNFVIKISTETENTLWQVFSYYKIPTTNDYLQISFTNEEMIKFSELLINRSEYDFNTSVTEEDKILTLSTCFDKEKKAVLHAKLIKRESKNSD